MTRLRRLLRPWLVKPRDDAQVAEDCWRWLGMEVEEAHRAVARARARLGKDAQPIELWREIRRVQ